MAIYSWSAANETVGQQPADFTAYEAVTSFLIDNDGSENYMSFVPNSATHAFLQFTPPGLNLTDCEVRMRWRAIYGNQGLVARATDSDNYIRMAGDIGVVQIDGGSYGVVYNSSLNVDGTTIRTHVAQFIGSDVKSKRWSDGESDPGAWYKTGTTTVTAGGFVGPWAHTLESEIRIYEFEVRTGSDMEGVSAPDTDAPTFDTTPSVTSTSATGHAISQALNEAGTVYGVRLASGATAPTSAQVKAGQDSAGSAAPEAKSSAAANSATLTFSTGSASTAYDYYIVAEDDEGTPNLQASPTKVSATTSAVAVEGLPAYTLKKDGTALGSLTGVKVRVTATGEIDGTELYSANNLTTTAGVMGTIDLSATAASVGDTVTVSILTGANEGITFEDTVEDIA